MAYQLSPADQQKLTDSQERATIEQTNLVKTYINLYGKITEADLDEATKLGWLTKKDATLFNYIITYIVGGMWAGKNVPPGISWTMMKNSKNLPSLLPSMPASGEPLLASITSYLNAIGPSTAMMDSMNTGNACLYEIKKRLRELEIGVAGFKVVGPDGTIKIVPKYSIPESSQQIKNSLNSSRTISLKIEVEKNSQSQYNLSIDGRTGFSSSGPILSFSAGTTTSYNLEELSGSGSKLAIFIEYKGYNGVSILPEKYIHDTGWHFPSLLAEANRNWQAGSQANSGFVFTNAPRIDLSSFPNGRFNRLSHVVISNYPTVRIEYLDGDYSKFSSVFQSRTSGTVKLFGLIPIAGASQSTYQSELKQSSSNSQFSLTLTPPSTASVPTPQQSAYVIGGVVVSDAENQNVSLMELLGQIF